MRDDYLLAPEVIVIGGGIAQQKHILEPLITEALQKNIQDAHYFAPKNMLR